MKKSIGNWAACDGVTDDSQNVSRAFAAAKNAAFTLVVDCPVYLHIGMDIAKSIFIESGTTVEFTAAGKFRLDNVFHPAFVMLDATNITLTNWNVEYDASIPVNWDVGGFLKNGQVEKAAGYAQPAVAFNSEISAWLVANRMITFDQSSGAAGSIWVGPTNSCAVFFLSGDTSKVQVTGMRLYAPAAAGGDRFVPMAFSMTPNFRSNQTVTANTSRTSQTVGVPHDLTFADIDLDGTYMGWQGTAQNAVFERIRSHRYGDLQDARGNFVGGVKKWFAPPHLFYLNYDPSGDPALFGSNIHIEDVVDYGVRIGVARDKGGDDSEAGYALSLKIGCIDCSVDRYQSARPDGFLDVLSSDGMTISNVVASYDSSFINNLYPGWRFPTTPYKQVTFENVTLTDTAATTLQMPIGSAGQSSNQGIVFKNVEVIMNRWSGANTPIPFINGLQNDIAVKYLVNSSLEMLATDFKANFKVNFQGTPSQIKSGESVNLTWSSQETKSCALSGEWTGAAATWGARSMKLSKPGNYDFVLVCQGSGDTVQAAVRVVVDP